MKKLLPPFFFLITIIGCNFNELDFKDLEPPLIDGTFALPIGFVDYTMRELLDSIGDTGLNLSEDSSSLLYLTYRDTAYFNSVDELVTIGDISNDGLIELENFTNPGPDVTTQKFDSTFTFIYSAQNNEEIDSIFYNSGTLEIDIEKTFPYDLIYDVSIQNTLTKTGNTPINIRGTLADSESSTTIQRDLSNYKTLLTFVNGQNTFEFIVAIDVVLEPGESISSTDFVNLNLTYQNQTFDILYGKFGQDTTNIGDQVLEIDFFSDLGQSGLEFGAPTITFDFVNSFGIPLGILFNGIYGIDSASADTTYLSGGIANSPQLIDAPEIAGELTNSSIVLNRNNSSLQGLLSGSPDKLGFNLSAISNPQDPNQSNFILEDSDVTTYIEMYMPMEIALKNLTRKFNFDLGDGLDFDEADSLSLRLVSKNGLPFSALLKFEIVNDSLGTSFEVPNTLVLESGFLNSSGIVIQPRKTIADIPIGAAGVEAIRNGGNLRLEFILNTPSLSSSNPFIKVLADYQVEMQLSIVGKVNYQP